MYAIGGIQQAVDEKPRLSWRKDRCSYSSHCFADHRASFPRQGVSPVYSIYHLQPVMARLPGAKNKTRIEMTLSPWYGEKLKELRVDSGFESDQAFSAWLLKQHCADPVWSARAQQSKAWRFAPTHGASPACPEVINE